MSVLQIAVAAMLCGVKSKYAVGQWAKERLEDDPTLLEALGCQPKRCPSNATIHRVFKDLDVVAFERVLGEWLSRTGLKPNEPLAVDGKTLRGIHGEEIPGVHLVAVYALHSDVVLSQMTTPDDGGRQGDGVERGEGGAGSGGPHREDRDGGRSADAARRV